MRYNGDRVEDLNIAYIGGGSREWAYKLMQDLALEAKLSGTVRLYDIDTAAAHDNELIGNLMTQRAAANGKWAYRTVTSMEAAITGADFIIISILPGTFDEMDSDVHAPEKYGIYQSVGDTVGPGGLMRALRTVPLYAEFAKQIAAYAPDAWVINYTNPMTQCTRTLYEVFPQIKAFGCCHEVFGTQELLAAMLKEVMGIEATRDEIKVNVLGVNHFTWLDKARYQGIDLFPLYREFALKYLESGYEINGKAWDTDPFSFAHRVKFDLFLRFGIIAAAGDRHLAEFLPPWYLKDPETVKQWKFHLTTVDFRKKRRVGINEQRQRLISGAEKLELKATGEEGVRQIKALLGLGDLVTNVNLPNRGQIAGLPLGAIVETNALLASDSIRPLLAGKLPAAIQSMVARHAINQETINQAALTKDRELAFRAFLNEPLLTLDPQPARVLFDEMLANTKAYLPGWEI